MWTSLGTALDELLATRGFDEITLKDIASAAGIARNTIYNYAPDKVALLLDVTTRASDELRTAVSHVVDQPGLTPADKLRDVIELLLSSFARDAHRAFVLYQHARKRSDRSDPVTLPLLEIQTMITDVLEEGMATGDFAEDLNPAVDVLLLSGLVEAGVHLVVHDPSAVTSVNARTTNLMLSAVAPRSLPK